MSAPQPRRRARARDVEVEAAAELPVARVAVELSPPHLDRSFEYLVPATLDAAATPGVRVKVRFGGQDVDGYLLERVAEPEHDGALTPLRRVVSAEPVLTPAVGRLARAVADHYAGTLPDVLRLAVPPRHARTEGEVPRSVGADVEPADPRPTAVAWTPYRGGPAFLSHLSAGGSPRAAWVALPGPAGESWAEAIAEAVVATLVSGRGALVVVPDARDVDRVCAALDAAGVPAWDPTRPDSTYVRLMADEGPSRRYRAFLAVLRGLARVVVGTRAAAFAPVRDLGLAVCWDDGDDLHAEPRAPYPHVREVLGLRAELEEAGLLLAAHGRSVETQALVASGWVREVAADRAEVRRRTPRVRALTSVELAREGPAAAARLPAPAWRTIRERLADGPVLVQVPRAGYLPAVACARCRSVARCTACHGPLQLGAAQATAQCGWCGRLATDWRCDHCGHGAFRSVSVGSDRTAEELGRAFPGVTVRTSGARSATGVLAEVPGRPALVVCTIGAEPVAVGGYAAAVLLDAAVSTGSTSLRATEEALRRWLAAAALVRSDGQVLLVGDGAERPTQALVRWDPAGLAARELEERSEVGLPPAVRVAELVGERGAVRQVLGRVPLPTGGDVLGPVPVQDAPEPLAEGPVQLTLAGSEDEVVVRALVRVPVGAGRELARALGASMAVRSARRELGAVRVRLDPREML
nr:primosomal protein N' [Cellulomonas sp. RIT-PI-Y]